MDKHIDPKKYALHGPDGAVQLEAFYRNLVPEISLENQINHYKLRAAIMEELKTN